ncbi:MAG: putative sulfate exporter family transporter [Candidatus Sabulitectum sp.]|nr:putative sulfate exporter family transporter [Candidatus Sabulitectum sp.]
MKYTWGIVLCISLGISANALSLFIPLGPVAIAIILGIAAGNILKPGKLFSAGITFSEKRILSIAVALMGVNLNFMILKDLGYQCILIITAAMAVTISSSLLFAKIFKFDRKFALLLGIGNGICGSSAIAATREIIGVEEEEVGFSVAIINFLGTLGIFLLPFIGTVVLKFSEINTGVLIGNTLQAVGQVVASGFSVGESAGQTATVVKMARVLMLTPVVFILISVFPKNNATESGSGRKNTVPLFIVGFVLFSLVPTFSLLPEDVIHVISRISHYALIVAMAGIGLGITFSSILRDGKKALLVGSSIFVLQVIFSSTMIYIFLR